MSYVSYDFDRHPMPRSVVARIRERLSGKSGDAAAWKDTHKPTGDDQASFAAGSLTGTVGNEQQPVSSPARISAVPGIRSE